LNVGIFNGGFSDSEPAKKAIEFALTETALAVETIIATGNNPDFSTCAEEQNIQSFNKPLDFSSIMNALKSALQASGVNISEK
jgi:hypothetical protein